MERSEIRERPLHKATPPPDYASLHPATGVAKRHLHFAGTRVRTSVIAIQTEKRRDTDQQGEPPMPTHSQAMTGAAAFILGALITTPVFAQTCTGPLRKINVGVAVAPPNVVHTAPYVVKALGFFAKR